MTISSGDYVVIVQTADGEDVAIGCDEVLGSTDDLVTPYLTADDYLVPLRVDGATKENEQGFPVITADDEAGLASIGERPEITGEHVKRKLDYLGSWVASHTGMTYSYTETGTSGEEVINNHAVGTTLDNIPSSSIVVSNIWIFKEEPLNPNMPSYYLRQIISGANVFASMDKTSLPYNDLKLIITPTLHSIVQDFTPSSITTIAQALALTSKEFLSPTKLSVDVDVDFGFGGDGIIEYRVDGGAFAQDISEGFSQTLSRGIRIDWKFELSGSTNYGIEDIEIDSLVSPKELLLYTKT